MNTHRAIFKGLVVRRIYKFSPSFNTIIKDTNTIDYKVLEEVALDDPPLNIGDRIYINSIGEIVLVIDKIRSTDNTYTYVTNYVVNVIEDEISQTSKIKAEKEKEIYNTKWWKKLFAIGGS